MAATEGTDPVHSTRAKKTRPLKIVETYRTVSDRFYDVAALVATTILGQFVYRHVNNLLLIVEKTAKWSVPHTLEPQQDEGMHLMEVPLVRPLPWLMFIPLLVGLRLTRVALSLVARLVRKEQIYPSTMVTFLQSRRRKLRALKYRGQRLRRINRIERRTGLHWLGWIMRPLRMIVCAKIPLEFDDVQTVVYEREDSASAKRSVPVDADDDADDSDFESPLSDMTSDTSFPDCNTISFDDSSIGEELESASPAAPPNQQVNGQPKQQLIEEGKDEKPAETDKNNHAKPCAVLEEEHVSRKCSTPQPIGTNGSASPAENNENKPINQNVAVRGESLKDPVVVNPSSKQPLQPQQQPQHKSKEMPQQQQQQKINNGGGKRNAKGHMGQQMQQQAQLPPKPVVKPE